MLSYPFLPIHDNKKSHLLWSMLNEKYTKLNGNKHQNSQRKKERKETHFVANDIQDSSGFCIF